jgi:hypothetical protein
MSSRCTRFSESDWKTPQLRDHHYTSQTALWKSSTFDCLFSFQILITPTGTIATLQNEDMTNEKNKASKARMKKKKETSKNGEVTRVK